jgi:uncharacterized membrane protein
VRWFRLGHALRSSLWFIPVSCVAGGVILSFLTIAIDRASNNSLIPQTFTGDAQSALQILSTVAASMVTLTGLVLTIVLVVVQLANGQYGPRVVRTFLQDKPSQFAIGVFVATFAHAMLAMREVHGDTVPGLAIVVAYILIVVSIVVLILYVHHIGRSLRVSSIIDSVGDDTLRLVDARFQPGRVTHDDPNAVRARKSGVLFATDEPLLVDLAREADVVLELVPAVGDFVPMDGELVRIHGPASRVDTDRLRAALVLGRERTLNNDAAYGIRMLVDVATHALSDNVDPTTAVQVVDRLQDVMRRLGTRRFPDPACYDDDGTLRLVVPRVSWEGYVHMAFDEIVDFGGDATQVCRRVLAALDDLEAVVDEDRRPALRQVRQRLFDRARASLVADDQGLGSGADLMTRPDGDALRLSR